MSFEKDSPQGDVLKRYVSFIFAIFMDAI